MGKVLAVCFSEKKGTQKININSANFIKDFGIENDAHGGNWHRQISLLSSTKIEEFNAKGADVFHGAFGENLVVEDIDFNKLEIGTKFKCNDVILQLTQIGKECHTRCQIFDKMGECIMPTNGVFATVLQAGKITVGDIMEIICE